MEKLIKKYNEECSFISRNCDILWKSVQIIVLIIFLIFMIAYKRIDIAFLILILGWGILKFICQIINLKSMINKLGIKEKYIKNILQKEYRQKIYKEMDKFQKDWITCYCKKNKLDRIDKLKIIRDEINQKVCNSSIKYINPVIIGTLVLAAWEIFLNDLTVKIGVPNTIGVAIIFGVVISIFIGYGEKEIKENRDFFNLFSKWSGYNRLNELLLYKILKCKK